MRLTVVRFARRAVVALALAAGACRRTASPRAATTPPAPGTPPPSPQASVVAAPSGRALLPAPRFADVGGRCQVGAHVVVGTSSADLSLYSVVVAANAEGALVAWRTGPEEMSAPDDE